MSRFFGRHLIIFSLLLISFSHLCCAESTFNSVNNSSIASDSSLTTEDPEFLPVQEAFRSSITQQGNRLSLNWTIADHYYLYKSRFKFSVAPADAAVLGAAEFATPGETKQDEYFGEVLVYHHAVDIELPIQPTSSTPTEFKVVIEFQGCAEAGLCYPPTKIEYPVDLAALDYSAVQSSSAITQNTAHSVTNNPSTSVSAQPASASPSSDKLNSSNTQSILNFLQGRGLLTMMGVFFLLGLGLTFTPCVLPMIPILSSVIAGQQQPLTARRGFILSSSYVIGMALTFAIAGLVVGLTGARLQIWMQNPIVLSVFSGLFVFLALAMFGFYEMQLPAFLRDRLNNINQQQQGGHWLGVFIMGILSALVVSPCVSAPLAAALLYIAQTGSPLLGAVALLALGLGMGAPLIVIGTTGANIMPRAGGWMDSVKAFFGIMLLAVAAWLIRSVLPAGLMMIIWAALLIIPAVYLLTTSHSTGWRTFGKGVGVMLLTYGILIVIGAAAGNTNPLQPITLTANSASNSSNSTASGVVFTEIRSVAQLQQALAEAKQNQRPVMLDYYADWCIACVEMEHDAFQNPEVKKSLEGFTLLQANLTDNPETDALLSQFKLIGPPSILFFNPQGQWLEKSTVMGQMNSAEFNQHLQVEVLPKL